MLAWFYHIFDNREDQMLAYKGIRHMTSHNIYIISI